MPDVNLCPNPSGAVDISDWLGSGTRTRLTGLSGPPRATGGSVAMGTGSFSASISPSCAAAVQGQAWTGVCWARSSVARTIRASLICYNGTSFVNGSAVGAVDTSLSANVWTQLRVRGTLSSSLTFTGVTVNLDLPTTGSSGTLSLSSIRLDPYDDSALTFADGGTSGWGWDGTSGKSTSRLLSVLEPGRMLMAA